MSDFLKVAKKAAKAGGEVILKYFNKSLSFEQKADKTFVSQADKESEEEIKKIIFEAFPDHSIIGEEGGKSGNGEYIWHVDPLDGTSNFKNNISIFCVSIGLERKGEFILGVIYNPVTKELFYAELGKGAYLNENKINVNSQSLSEGVVVIDASFSGKRADIKPLFQRDMVKIASRIRMIGSNALQLADLAKGSYCASISDHIKSYDFVAGLVIAKEAGAIVTDQCGKSPTTLSDVIVASNNLENHKSLIEFTKIHYSKD